MRKKITNLILSGLIAFGFAAVLPAASVFAQSLPPASRDAVCQGVNGATGTTECGTAAGGDALPALIRSVINILLFIIGLIAVIMIIVGGIRYVLSGGDGSNTKAAKDTILYSVIGLVIALLAFAIVNFVVGAF